MILAPLSHPQKPALIPTRFQWAAARNEGPGYAGPAAQQSCCLRCSMVI